jgi:hypothetical protein
VFVVSRVWFERKWCLAEMLLAIATGDDSKCKVIQFGSDFRADLVPLHQRVLRERFDATKLLSQETTRLVQWVLSSMDATMTDNDDDDDDDKVPERALKRQCRQSIDDDLM